MTTERPFSVRGKRVTVAGAARSGVAAAELLIRRGATVTLSDMREELDDEERLRSVGVELELGGHRTPTFTGADLVVASPGVPPHQPALEAARAAGVPVIGELELASRWLRGRVIAITGTKGKSTTTTLIGRMLEAGGRPVLVGGNIGTALSGQVDDSTEDVLHVVETSSFQLEATVTFHPWIAVLLNFSADHLDRHESVEAYGAAKARIFARQTESDWAVVNADDPPAMALAAGTRARRLLFSTNGSLDDGIVIDGDTIVRRTAAGQEPLVLLSAIKLIGRHLTADVLAACAVASLVGIDAASMTHAVEGFSGLEHALERAGEVGGVRFVNDSKATNIEAARRAIESFGPGLVVILGGRFKGGAFSDLTTALEARRATVIAIGEARPLIAEALRGRVTLHEAADMSAAVRTAFATAAPGNTVVLAPACASFDMFRDYAERGRVFKQEVSRLQEEWLVTREQ
jgi:UDP-N-acetylmuramoylalanine--D-glutamate ligase